MYVLLYGILEENLTGLIRFGLVKTLPQNKCLNRFPVNVCLNRIVLIKKYIYSIVPKTGFSVRPLWHLGSGAAVRGIWGRGVTLVVSEPGIGSSRHIDYVWHNSYKSKCKCHSYSMHRGPGIQPSLETL